MNFYKALIQYKGTSYFGWQIQRGQGQATIQGELNHALERLVKSTEIKTMGSGRTDAGVHALEQVVKIQIPFHIEISGMVKGLNSLLPADIRILGMESCDSNFHPVADAVYKDYLYVFTMAPSTSCFVSDLVTHLKWELDFELLSSGIEEFIGEYDFQNYFCVGTPVKSTKRTILEAELSSYALSGPFVTLAKEYHVIRFRGNGFLKQMVRLMVGVLFEMGRGKITREQLRQSLRAPLSHKLGPVAPANGLYLSRVQY